jgi:hypothetical protein
MINFYQLILTTNFQNFEISQILVEISTPNLKKKFKLSKFGLKISTQFRDIKIQK